MYCPTGSWKDALQGALLGDALGVPHEFKQSWQIPVAKDIHMVMPADYPKSHGAVPYGTWSDDGSQLLALLTTLEQGGGTYRESVFLSNMLAWLHEGRFQAGGRVFDIGRQTQLALEQREAGQPLAPMSPGYCGNGSLMRVLPVAWLPDVYGIDPDEAIRTAMTQSSLTHPQLIARATCALYVELCWGLAGNPQGDVHSAVRAAEANLRERGVLTPDELLSLDTLMAFQRESMPTGGGFVVNTFWSALWACSQADSLSAVLQAAIGMGHDTDTTACVAGGLAALCYGVDPLAARWWAQMDTAPL